MQKVYSDIKYLKSLNNFGAFRIPIDDTPPPPPPLHRLRPQFLPQTNKDDLLYYLKILPPTDKKEELIKQKEFNERNPIYPAIILFDYCIKPGPITQKSDGANMVIYEIPTFVLTDHNTWERNEDIVDFHVTILEEGGTFYSHSTLHFYITKNLLRKDIHYGYKDIKSKNPDFWSTDKAYPDPILYKKYFVKLIKAYNDTVQQIKTKYKTFKFGKPSGFRKGL
jgi:hypothetical protein